MRKKPSPSTPTTTAKVLLTYPAGYFFSFMANRYALTREDGFTLVHFGLLNRGNDLLDHFSCMIPEHTLNAQKENLVQYSDSIGLPKSNPPPWAPPPSKERGELGRFPVVDFLHLCNWEGAHAEICFWSYSHGQAADLARAESRESVRPWGIALLRSNLDLQRAFLAELYLPNS